MTTEEERKAAAEKVRKFCYEVTLSGVVQKNYYYLNLERIIDLQCALTRTEKRLEVAEGMLREIAPHMNEMSKEAYHRLAPKVHAFVTHPPAEGE